MEDKRNKKGQFVEGNNFGQGRPKGTFSLIAILKKKIQEECPDDVEKKTYADLIIKRMLKEAIEKGDQSQIRLIWNYIEGMPKQSMNINAKIENYDWGNYKQGDGNNILNENAENKKTM